MPLMARLFVVNFCETGGWAVRFPRHYGGSNSPFSVRDINGGDVAWVYYRGQDQKPYRPSVAIHAGCGPEAFMAQIRQIPDALGPYDPEEEE